MIIKWVTCPDHPDYEINRLGEIRSAKTGRVLKPYDDDDGYGYLRVKLDGQNCRLHILVALAFIPNDDPENKTIVNHKRGDKHDCRASQLEWCTPSENTKHAWDTGLIPRKKRKGRGGWPKKKTLKTVSNGGCSQKEFTPQTSQSTDKPFPLAVGT